MTNTQQLRQTVNGKLAEYNAARIQYRQEKEALEEAETRIVDLREALTIAQAVAKQIQEEAHHKIADIVSHSLSVVFDEPYKFKIKFEQKRGRTEAELVFDRDGMEVDPMMASGGGVVDVAAFALRISCLLLSRPALQKCLVLDEPFKFVSAEYRGKVRELVENLSDKLKVQFVIVTHIDEFKMGTVVEI